MSKKLPLLERIGTFLCPKCKGMGVRWKRKCSYCEGEGRVNMIGVRPTQHSEGKP